MMIKILNRFGRMWYTATALWVMVASCSIFAFNKIDKPRYLRLVEVGISGVGTVESINKIPRGTIDFEYEVNGQKFHDRQHPFPPNTRPEQLAVGQVVKLTYDPQWPRECFLGDPKPRLRSYNLFSVIASVAMASVVTILCLWYLRKFLKS